MANRPHLRPPSVSLVCYLLLIGAAFGLFIALNVLREPASEIGQLLKLVAVAVPIVSGLCGWFMLGGFNWARNIFFCAAVPLAVVWLAFQFNGLAIARLILLAIYCILLLRPGANRYFAGGNGRSIRTKQDCEVPLPTGRRRSYDY
jgi:hypothetical protein